MLFWCAMQRTRIWCCEVDFTVKHALPRTKWRFVTMTHDGIGDTVDTRDLCFAQTWEKNRIYITFKSTSLHWSKLIIRHAWAQCRTSSVIDVNDTKQSQILLNLLLHLYESGARDKKLKFSDACQSRHIGFSHLGISVDDAMTIKLINFIKRLLGDWVWGSSVNSALPSVFCDPVGV